MNHNDIQVSRKDMITMIAGGWYDVISQTVRNYPITTGIAIIGLIVARVV